MANFTPGPWICCGNHVDDSRGLPLIRDARKFDEINGADHRLIAAAPELYEALDTLTLVVGLTPAAGNKAALQEAVDIARAAIKKARGE